MDDLTKLSSRSWDSVPECTTGHSVSRQKKLWVLYFIGHQNVIPPNMVNAANMDHGNCLSQAKNMIKVLFVDRFLDRLEMTGVSVQLSVTPRWDATR